MKDSQLEKLSLKELTELRERLGKHIASRQESEKTTLKEELMMRAQEAGFSITDLFPTGRKTSKGKGSSGTMYRNPDNPSQTWPGRGRKPKWLAAAGDDIERFKVR